MSCCSARNSLTLSRATLANHIYTYMYVHMHAHNTCTYVCVCVHILAQLREDVMLRCAQLAHTFEGDVGKSQDLYERALSLRAEGSEEGGEGGVGDLDLLAGYGRLLVEILKSQLANQFSKKNPSRVEG